MGRDTERKVESVPLNKPVPAYTHRASIYTEEGGAEGDLTYDRDSAPDWQTTPGKGEVAKTIKGGTPDELKKIIAREPKDKGHSPEAAKKMIEREDR